MVEFSTLSDYLFLLRTISEASGPHGPGIMFYLAAAVSDFYIPDEKMVCCFAILLRELSLNIVIVVQEIPAPPPLQSLGTSFPLSFSKQETSPYLSDLVPL